MEKKILIVDDDAGVRSMVSEFLGNTGFSVVTAGNGKEGIKVAQRLKPDLILLDVTMPKMDGFAALEKLKQSEKTMSIPVVMLTAISDEESKLKASSLYSQYYLTKPFNLKELASKIREILRMTI